MDLIIFMLYYFMRTISVLGLVIWVVLSLIELQKTKKIRFTGTKTISGLILLVLFYVSLPILLCSFYFIGEKDPEELTKDELEKEAALFNFSAKIAVIPHIKGEFYSLAGGEYMSLFNGKKALDCFKAAERYKKKSDPLVRHALCTLYFWNEDDKNIEEYCTTGPLVVNHIRNNDYITALQLLNNSIGKSNRRSSCMNYALRSYVYRKTGHNKQADNDYSTAVSLCPKNKLVRSYSYANNILDVYNGGREYGNKLKF